MTAALMVNASPAAPTPHPESDRLSNAIRQVSSLDISWAGPAYRVASVARANEADLLSGEGSRLWGYSLISSVSGRCYRSMRIDCQNNEPAHILNTSRSVSSHRDHFEVESS